MSLLGSIKRGLFGRGEKVKQFDTMSPQQQAAQNQMLSILRALGPDVQQYLGGLLSGDPEALEAYQARYMRQFEEQIIPQLAERFTGADGQRSSAFGQQLGAQGASLAEMLAAQRGQLAQGALSGLQGMYGSAFSPSFGTYHSPRQSGLLGNLLASGAGGFSSGVGKAFEGIGSSLPWLSMVGL